MLIVEYTIPWYSSPYVHIRMQVTRFIYPSNISIHTTYQRFSQNFFGSAPPFSLESVIISHLESILKASPFKIPIKNTNAKKILEFFTFVPLLVYIYICVCMCACVCLSLHTSSNALQSMIKHPSWSPSTVVELIFY